MLKKVEKISTNLSHGRGGARAEGAGDDSDFHHVKSSQPWRIEQPKSAKSPSFSFQSARVPAPSCESGYLLWDKSL